MKKVRIFLAALALITAVGVSFANYLRPLNTVAYEWIPGGVGQCVSHDVNCTTDPGTPCTVTGSTQLREVNDTANSCGRLMSFQ
jgi:hypothetical protein